MIVKVEFGRDRLHGMVWTGHQDPSRYKSGMKSGGITIWKLFIISYMIHVLFQYPCHIRSSLNVDLFFEQGGCWMTSYVGMTAPWRPKACVWFYLVG